MLIGFFIGAFIGSFAGGWFAFIGGCMGALVAQCKKWERELAPYTARERRREAKRRSAKARVAKRTGAATLATAAVASQWHDDHDDTVSDGMLSGSFLINQSVTDINPATGLPMLDGCIDVAGNMYGCSNDDLDLGVSDDLSDAFIDDSFSSFSDDW